MGNEYFLLYASCIPVKGAKRSLLYDLQRGRARLIPNLLYDILSNSRKNSVKEIKKMYGTKYDFEIDQIFQELKKDEWGFFSKYPKHFPPLKRSFVVPNKITNAIIDIDTLSQHPWEKIFKELDYLGCIAIELRFYNKILLSKLKKILHYTQKSRLKAIIIYLNYNKLYTIKKIKELQNLFPRVKSMTLYNAPYSKVIIDKESKSYNIRFLKYEMKPDVDCGLVHNNYFTINYQFFLESCNYNNCLYKKISIDRQGYIKNCPSMKKDYGHISSNSLISTIKKTKFQKLWNIKKDDISVCKICEFRYMCQDCRVFIKDKADKLSKPKKCHYNPNGSELQKIIGRK